MVTDLRYADDAALLGGSREELQRLTDRVKRAGLALDSSSMLRNQNDGHK